MKVALLAFALGLAASGCRERHYPIEEAVGPQYSGKHGLLLPEETRRSIGLQVVEVGVRKGSETLDIEARVYAREENVAKASGVLGMAEAKRLTPGQAVEIRIMDRGSQEPATPVNSVTTGKIVSVSEHLRMATGQLELLVEFAAPPSAVAIGTVVSARIALPGGDTVIMVPKSALLQCTEGDFIYTVSGEHFVRTAVKAGAIHGEVVEIREGLLSGDEVVSKPVMSLWLTELAAVKGGQACCIEPPRGK